MSLKDDFLEALRSVKKDIFKDYEYTESDGGPAPPPQRPEPVREQPASAEAPATPSWAPPQAPGAAQPASPSYRAAAAWAAELHNDTDLDGEGDDEDNTPDVDTKPYRMADSSDGGSGFSDFLPSNAGRYEDENRYSGGSGGMVPPDGNRVIFGDFDPDDYSGNDKTVISKNTIIRGALQTEDSIRMFGQIMGDIDCKANILVAGKVRGNTSAANAYVIDAQVDGNLLCDDVINVTDDAWILGNIRAQQAEIDGKIKGNIEIRHAISIGSNSSVIGNISTDELEIKRGAFINGQIMMYSPSRDVIDKFDQFDR